MFGLQRQTQIVIINWVQYKKWIVKNDNRLNSIFLGVTYFYEFPCPQVAIVHIKLRCFQSTQICRFEGSRAIAGNDICGVECELLLRFKLGCNL
jgi:hypothetical protein